MEVVEDGSLRAWKNYEGSHQGFSGDVRAAWIIARSEQPLDNLGKQIRCVLALSSIQIIVSLFVCPMLSPQSGHW